MAEVCDTFQTLAVRAQQQRAPAGLQQMQQGAEWTQLDAALQVARQEAPSELRRWWEAQLVSGRVQTLQDEIAKWKRNTLTLHGNQTQGRERLQKLHAVEAAIGSGDMPHEMLTTHGWSAYKRDRQMRELQASSQAQPADTTHLQRTPPLQNGTAASWKNRVGRRRGMHIMQSPHVWHPSIGVSTHVSKGICYDAPLYGKVCDHSLMVCRRGKISGSNSS